MFIPWLIDINVWNIVIPLCPNLRLLYFIFHSDLELHCYYNNETHNSMKITAQTEKLNILSLCAEEWHKMDLNLLNDMLHNSPNLKRLHIDFEVLDFTKSMAFFRRQLPVNCQTSF